MNADLSTLIVEVRAGEKLSVSAGREVSIELLEKSGKQARLKIVAPRDVKIEKKGVTNP